MSKDTVHAQSYTPGAQKIISEPVTDIDGEVYPGERLDLISSLIFSTESCEQTGSLHSYMIHDDSGAKVPAIKVFLTDEMDHDAELTVTPSELQRIADWFQRQAAKAQGQSAERGQVPA